MVTLKHLENTIHGLNKLIQKREAEIVHSEETTKGLKKLIQKKKQEIEHLKQTKRGDEQQLYKLQKSKRIEMKLLLLPILILFLISSSAFGEIDFRKVDLDNDGEEEFITVYQRYDLLETPHPWRAESIVRVFNSEEKKVGSFSMPEVMLKVEFVSFDKNGTKQIIAWSNSGMHYTNLSIYGYENGRLYKIFENGSACFVETNFELDKPIIKVGRANWEQEGWCYASGEPLWQVFVWDGERFIYDEELSTTPIISEEEEIERYVDKYNEPIKKEKIKE